MAQTSLQPRRSAKRNQRHSAGPLPGLCGRPDMAAMCSLLEWLRLGRSAGRPELAALAPLCTWAGPDLVADYEGTDWHLGAPVSAIVDAAHWCESVGAGDASLAPTPQNPQNPPAERGSSTGGRRGSLVP
jgi:hypothetical protein